MVNKYLTMVFGNGTCGYYSGSVVTKTWFCSMGNDSQLWYLYTYIYIYIFSTMVLWQVYGNVMAFLMGIYSGSTVLFSMGMIRDYG